MDIKLELNISENIICDLYNDMCSENECEYCPNQVLPNEFMKYDGCRSKYIDNSLKSDIQYKVNQLFR